MEIVGTIRLKNGTTADLGSNGRWRSKSKTTASLLNTLYAPKNSGLDAIMPFGLIVIADAAKALDAEIIKKPENPPLPESAIS